MAKQPPPQQPGASPKSSRSKRGQSGPRKRIETQIHRRRTVTAIPPFEAEWDAATGERPAGLRTPPDQMKPGGRQPDPDASDPDI